MPKRRYTRDGRQQFLLTCGDHRLRPCVIVCEHVLNEGAVPMVIEWPPEDGTKIGQIHCNAKPHDANNAQIICVDCAKDMLASRPN